MTRRRYSLYIEEPLTDRLRLYASALAQTGERLSLSGLLEAALYEYLESRCDRMGIPRDGTSAAPAVRHFGRGRPSASTLAGQFSPRLAHRAGRYPGRSRQLGRGSQT